MAIYTDLDLTLTRNNAGDITINEDAEAIRNSISNIVQTMQQSRRMLPEFAGRLHGILFEPIDKATAETLGDLIIGVIEKWDDRVIIEKLYINPKPDQNLYQCKLVFKVKSTNAVETLDFILAQR